ncbi:threonylcarbamoyl-AMP synthase [Thiospirochaeta perfilievii]|uniref:Threonylcarbamoyl-AMP synthase n=1 Tax=Thiospirochaeta perfilievii TaxID=252967 RepID=A0A5C1QAP5_9SPIO|nr:L-threonylcarbamoyladenylate synthase [Thiospirochaeta perfilievii]QEN04581.1 threonylcarbamoyl-AMP synthase [Thiospirochaeta perfilievii]
MIEYVYENNIDIRAIKKACHVLDSGGLVAFPTESSWSIGCSIDSKEGLQKLKTLKGGKKINSISVLCCDIKQIQEMATLSNSHFKLIKKYTPGPYVFILPAKSKIEKVINMKRAEVGVRIPGNNIPFELIKQYGNPLFVITAAREMTEGETWDYTFTRENLYTYGWEVEDIPGLDLVLDTGEELPINLSTVIRLTENEPELIRQGAGLIDG